MMLNRVSRVMGERRLSIAETARRAGLAYTVVFGLYHGTVRRVDLDTLNALCRTLEVSSLADLIEYVPDDRLGTSLHAFTPLSGSQDAAGRYQRCGVHGCMVAPEHHRRASSTAAEGGPGS